MYCTSHSNTHTKNVQQKSFLLCKKKQFDVSKHFLKASKTFFRMERSLEAKFILEY